MLPISSKSKQMAQREGARQSDVFEYVKLSEGGLPVLQLYLVPHAGLGAVHRWNQFRAQSLLARGSAMVGRRGGAAGKACAWIVDKCEM